MRDRDGGVRRCALLGPRARAARAHGTDYCGGVCATVSQEREERRQRCGGDLHGGATSEHALRGDEVGGAASGVMRASPAPGAGGGAHGPGGKTRLGRITKRGDAYLRTLLILGAKSALQAALRKPPAVRHRLHQWIVTVLDRIGYHKTLVAIANKHARIIWALLVKGEDFVVQHLTPKVVAGA